MMKYLIKKISVYLGLNKKPIKVYWKYRYVKEGQLEPDEFGRWMVIGYIRVNTKVMPEYKTFGGTIHIPIAYIHQKDTTPGIVPSVVDRFCCDFATIEDANLGYGSRNYFSSSLEELQNIVEFKINRTFNIFKHVI